jgi:hypothetical protein
MVSGAHAHGHREIPVHAAHRAKPEAVRLAEGFHRKRHLHALLGDRSQRHDRIREIEDVEILARELDLVRGSRPREDTARAKITSSSWNS